MSVEVDLRVLELVCSRLCHDLVSPVGAINNGIELATEMGGPMNDEAFGLIAHAAEQAARRLTLLRLAYGAAGSESLVSLRDVSAAADSYFQGGKVRLQIADPAAVEHAASRRGRPKALLNIILLASEAIGVGGTIDVASLPAGGFVVGAAGRNAGLREGSMAALRADATVEDLDARNIHAYLTRRFAMAAGLTLTATKVHADRFELTAVPGGG